MRAYSDFTGKTGVTGIMRYGCNDSSELSPPPTTSNGGSQTSFPLYTPRGVEPAPSTNYGGSLKAFPPSALPQDLSPTPRASTGSIAWRYIYSEENISQHGEITAQEEQMEETWKLNRPIPSKFEISDSSDELMTEVEWRDDEPYMPATKKRMKHNQGQGVQRPITPVQPIPNMPQIPTRRQFEGDWAKPADMLPTQDEPADPGKFSGEYLRNTNGLSNDMVGQDKYDLQYAELCVKQGEYVTARLNHTDAAIMSV